MTPEPAHTSRLHWRCVACRSENQTVLRARGGERSRNGAGSGARSGATRGATGGPISGPVETACANCRTRHILALGPGELRRIGPRDEIVRRSGTGPGFLPGLGFMMMAASGALLCLAAGGGALCAVAAGLVGLVGLSALAWIVARARGSEGFLSAEEGLEVRGPGGRRRALIPWEKIRAAEYRLLLGRRMALWLAVESPDGTVPPAPLVADTGIALFTRFRAMPQFLLAMAGRLGGRAPFLLPILTVVRSEDASPDAAPSVRLRATPDGSAELAAGLPAAERQAPLERLPGVAAERQAPLERLPGVAAERQAPLERLPGVAAERQAPLERLPGVAAHVPRLACPAVLSFCSEAPTARLGEPAVAHSPVRAGDAVALAIRSDLAPKLVSGTLNDEELPRS